jgi:hypothetical protein
MHCKRHSHLLHNQRECVARGSHNFSVISLSLPSLTAHSPLLADWPYVFSVPPELLHIFVVRLKKMDSSSHTSSCSDVAGVGSSNLSHRGKAGATGVYLKGSTGLNYGLGVSSTQMATAQVRCSNGDIYNESVS